MRLSEARQSGAVVYYYASQMPATMFGFKHKDILGSHLPKAIRSDIQAAGSGVEDIGGTSPASSYLGKGNGRGYWQT